MFVGAGATAADLDLPFERWMFQAPIAPAYSMYKVQISDENTEICGTNSKWIGCCTCSAHVLGVRGPFQRPRRRSSGCSKCTTTNTHTHIAASLDYCYALTCPIASCGKLSSMPSYNRASSLSSSDSLCWSTSISNCFQPRNASNGKNIEYWIMLCNTRGERCISTCYTVFRINMIVQLASASTNTAACNELLHAGSAYYTCACA